MTTIGFIGLGNMGGAIVRRLLLAGERPVVFDLSAEACAAYAARGAVVAASAQDVAQQADVTFACLPSGKASLDVARAVAAGGRSRVHVEMSTIGRKTISEIAGVLRAHDIALVDAPVSGGPKGADAGTLAVMVAGAPATVEKVRPALAAIAGKLLVVGAEPGLAQVCKVVNNAISMTTLVVSCEAVVAGVKAGMDARTLIDAINAGTARSSATADKITRSVLPRTFDYGAPLWGGIKDLELYLDEAQSLGLPAFSVSNTLQLWNYAVGRLDPDGDFTTIVKCFEEWAGVEVKG
jgi:3-hydroxyisobutyrate dehydrogenase-like beta-hydroxyacid dehydrogenase